MGSPDRFILESLEQRVLLSGDGLLGAPMSEDSVVGGGQGLAEGRGMGFGVEAVATEVVPLDPAGDIGLGFGLGLEAAGTSLFEGLETTPLSDEPGSVVEVPEGAAAGFESGPSAGEPRTVGEGAGVVGAESSGASVLVETRMDVERSGAASDSFSVSGLETGEAGSGTTSGDGVAGEATSQAEILVETLRAAQGPPGSSVSVSVAAASANEEGTDDVDSGVVEAFTQPSGPPAPERPLLVLPGIAGSFPSEADYRDWLINRGYDPTRLLIDPIVHGYDDLLASLVRAGYTRDVDLFAATYDWRMTPGPTDGSADGVIRNPDGSEITGDQITDATYEYGVDYVGYWLSRAAVAWAASHGNTLPSEVDVVAHSTGGLVVRVYLQSGAYGASAVVSSGKLGNGVAVPAGLKNPDGTPVGANLTLPRVHDLVTLGVPMRGAPTPFQLSQNDWGADVTYIGLGKVMDAAWELHYAGVTLNGPGSTTIPGFTSWPGLDPVTFIRRYSPGLLSLTATHPFLFDDSAHFTPSTVQQGRRNLPFNESALANRLVLDLNDGLDLIFAPSDLADDWTYEEQSDDPNPGRIHSPTAFVSALGGDLTVLYCSTYDTATALTRRQGPAAWNEFGDFDVTPFDSYAARDAYSFETWYVSNLAEKAPGDGDGSVPVESAVGLYETASVGGRRDPSTGLHLVALSDPGSESHEHLAMVSSTKGIREVLRVLGRDDPSYVVEGPEYLGVGLFTGYVFGGSEAVVPGAPALQGPPPSALVGFSSAQLGAIADGLLLLKTTIQAGLASTTPALTAQVALIGRTLGEGPLVMSQVLDATFGAAAALVRSLPSGATAVEVAEVLFDAGLVASGGLMDVTRSNVTLVLGFAQVVPSVSTLVLGAQAAEAGLVLSTAPVLALEDYFQFSARLSLDITRPAADLFAVSDYSATQGVSFLGRGLAAAVVMGSSGPATVSDGEAGGKAYAAQRLTEPSGDGWLTASELAAVPLESISEVVPGGKVEAALPTDTPDGKVIYAKTTAPVGSDPDLLVGSVNFEAIKDRLRELLEQLAALGDAMEDPLVQIAFGIPLPFLEDARNDTLEELLTDDRYGFGPDDFFDLVEVLVEYCDEAVDPNLSGLVDRLVGALRMRVGEGAEGVLAHGPIGVRGGFGVDTDTFELVIELDFEKAIDLTLTEQGFGPEGQTLGLDLSVPATATVGFETRMSLGMDLGGLLSSPSTGLGKEDVTLEIDRLRATFDLVVPDIDATVTLGFLTAAIVDGSARMEAAVDFTVNGGLPLTLAGLEGVVPSSLLSVAPGPTGTMEIRLPLSATVGSDDLTAGCDPLIVIADDQLFDGTPPTVTASELECLVDFANLSPMQVLAMLNGLGDWLAQFGDSSVFGVRIPFASGLSLGELFDFSQAFVDGVYLHLVSREIGPFGTPSVGVVNLGRLAVDATFDLALGDLPAVRVTVPAVDTQLNLSLEDLVIDFNAALQLSGLGVSIEAFVGAGRRLGLRLRPGVVEVPNFQLTVPDLDGSASTPNLNGMMAELGFGERQWSLDLPRFHGIDEFAVLLSEALAVSGVPFDVGLEWVEADGEIRMRVEFHESYARTATFAFDPDLGLGPLAEATAGGTFSITADVRAGFVLGFDLAHRETPRIQTLPTVPPPSTGVLTRAADFTLILDSDRYAITIPRDTGNSSLADLVADINARFTTGNGLKDRVIAQLSGNAIVLAVLDEDADGDGVFDAGEDLNGDGNFDRQLGAISLLQVVGPTDSTAFTELGFGNGQYDRADVRGLFVDDVVLEGAAVVSATGLEASFRFGIFAIILEDGAATGAASVSVGLQGPTGGTRFLLGDLLAAAPDFGSILRVAPVITGSIEVTAPTVTILPDLIDLPAGQNVRLYIPDLRFTDYNPAPYDGATNPTGLFITLPTMGGLGNFSCLTFLDIVQSLDALADQLEAIQGFGFLGAPIPLINRSMGDLLDTAGNLAELVEGLATADAETIETLEKDLETFFGVSDPRLITLSVEDFAPAAFDGGSGASPVTTRFNPSGLGNAIRFNARAAGTALRGVTVQFIDDGRYTGTTNEALAEYDAAGRTLRIYYHAGYTTAAQVVSRVSGDAGLPFTAELDTVTEAGTGTGTISLTALKFSLRYNLGFGDYLPLDLDLDDLVNLLPADDPARGLLGGLASVIQVEGSAGINVTAAAEMRVEFGIDVSNPCEWAPFLYDTTALTLSAAVRATDIDLTVAVGPLGVSVRDGRVTVDRDGDPDTTGGGEDAVFAVTFGDPDLDGRHYFRDGLGLLGDVRVDLEAGASAELPLYFPSESVSVGTTRDDNGDGHPDNELVIEIPRLPDLFAGVGVPVRISTPDLLGLLTDFNVCDVLTHASVLLDGLDALLGMLQDGLDGEVLNRRLPLVGDSLAEAGGFIREFREGLLARLRTQLATAGDPIELVKQAFWEVLGAPGLNLLIDASGDSLTSVEDIDIACESVNGEVALLFNLRLGRTTTLVDTGSNPIGFDIGIPGLGLSVDGGVKVEVGFELNLFFGISATDGFFFDTNGLDDDSVADDVELAVFFRVTLPGLEATGNLAFLQVRVSDETDGVSTGGGVRAPSLFEGEFVVDIHDANGRLSFSEMLGGGFDLGQAFEVELDATAAVRLDLEISFGDDARFPRLLAEFDLDWSWDPGAGSGGEGSGGDPSFGIHNIQLDLGSFISGFIGPILDEIRGIIEPIRPLVDLLTTPLPIFSDLDGSPITLLKLGENAGLIAPTTREFIEAVDIILDLVADTSVTASDNLYVGLGGFDFSLDSLGNVGAAGSLSDADLDPTSGVTDGDALGFMGNLERIGVTFPFLRLSELFKLFTGQPVSFVEVELPLLEFEASIDFQIPIFPPLYIIFGGSIGAKIDLTFGYDSLGLQTYFASTDKNLADLFQGFYVKDVDDYGNEITEVTLSGGLFAGAELDLLVVSAGVTGGIYADILFDLRDNDSDGRVRMSEIAANAKESPLCVFDVNGRIYASLDAFLEANLLIAKVEKEWNFGEITILEFSYQCPEPVLASFDTDGNGTESAAELSAGELVLHMGEYAARRQYGDTADGDETFTVRPVTTLTGGSQSVTVSFGGITQTYHEVKSILVKAGAGSDVVDLTGVSVPVTAYGGDGDDWLKAGRGGGTYHGENGNDTLTAERASDSFAGVADEFHGGSGNDTLIGYEGADELYGEDGNDRLEGGEGDDVLEGGEGNDEIFGEAGDDVMSGGGGVDYLEGGDGDDALFGGDGDDVLAGGAGEDALIGNGGDDELSGGTGDDVLAGDEATIVGLLEVTGVSGTGNDILSGGPGDDTLLGAGGNDALYGGNRMAQGVTSVVTVSYTLSGGSLVAEPDGADFLDGGEGDDVLFADDAHSGVATEYPGAEVGDRVWLDVDQDGVQDEGEPGLSGVPVELYLSGSTLAMARTVSGVDGAFRFAGLAAGDYFLRVTAPSGTSFVSALAGEEVGLDSDMSDSDGDGVGETEVFHLDAGESKLDLDAGVQGGTPSVSIGDSSVVEGDDGEIGMVFTVSLSSPASEVVTVIYRTGSDADGSTPDAVAGIDYGSVQYTLVFLPGTVSLEVVVPVIGDHKDEPNETLVVTLSDAFLGTTGLTISDALGVGVVVDDDEAPTVSIADAWVHELDGTNDVRMVFAVTLSHASWQTLKFDWRLLQVTNSDGSPAFDTATVGVDYVDATGVVRFDEDDVTRTFEVTVRGDDLDEYDERLLARISRHADTAASGFGFADDTAVGTIYDDNPGTSATTDDDPTPYVSLRVVGASVVDEGHAGHRVVELEVGLEDPSGREVTVHWSTQQGTALGAATLTEPADYVEAFGAVTLNPGETSARFEVLIEGDTRIESDEFFFVNLLSAVNGTLGVTAARPNHVAITVRNDESTDPGPWYVQFSDVEYTVTEGGLATITLVRAGDSSQPVAVYWAAGGTATPGVDYDGVLNPTTTGGRRGLVRFGVGETVQTFTIATFDNRDFLGRSVYEGDETVRLHLANPTGGEVRGLITDATLTILEDDPAPVITISDAMHTGHFAVEKLSDGSAGALGFEVRVSGASEVDVRVRYTSISGTATAEDDFVTATGVLTFPVGSLNTPQTVTITTKDDTEIEAVEDLFVVLTDAVNATIGDYGSDSDATGGEDSHDRGYGVILDDDQGRITGTVFHDANGNGFLDSSTDYGYAGVQVTFVGATDGTEYRGTTGADGSYSVGLPLDDYTVSVEETLLPEGASATTMVLPAGYAVVEAEVVLDLGFELPSTTLAVTGSTGSGTTGNNDTVYGGLGNDLLEGGDGDDWLVGGHWLGPGGAVGAPPYEVVLKETLGGSTRTRVYVDPARLPAPGVIRGRVWVDSDGDQTELKSTPGNESGLAEVQVNLYDATWTLIATAYTDGNGGYEFGQLAATGYQVQFLIPGGYAFVARGVGVAANDSDADPTVGLTATLAVAEGRTLFNIDAGVRESPAGSAPWNVSFDRVVYSVRESDGFAAVTLVGDGGSVSPVAVYRTANGTATSDADYVATHGIVRFGVGEMERHFLVTVLADEVTEGYETVLLSLTNPTGGPVHGAQPGAVVLIFDHPGEDDDLIEGGQGNDALLGDFGWFTDAGVPVLVGGMGNDELRGGEGEDLLEGEGGDDLLVGGAGDDTLNGGSENDRYEFDTDGVLGTDTVGEGVAPLGGADTLDFSTSGLSLDLDLTGTRLEVTNGTTTVLVLNYPADVLENVLAGSGDDILRGNDRDNVLDGGAGDDLLEGRGGDDDLTGGEGDDEYVFDADLVLGHDEVFEAAGRDIDTLEFGETTGQAVSLDLALTTSQVVAPTLTLTLSTADAGQEILLWGGSLLVVRREPISFGTNTSASSGIENLYGGRYAPGTGVQDRLSGNGRDNVIWGREGNDVLDGGSAGYDTLREERAGNWNLTSTTLSDASTGETDTYEASTFDEISLIGDEHANELDASSFAGLVRLDGAGGDDTLVGGTGTNYLTGGAGVDWIDGSLGYDILVEQRDADLLLTPSSLRIGGEVDTLIGTLEEAWLTGGDGPNNLVAVTFNGPVTLDGGAGDDTLMGSAFDDLLIGGAGNDALAGAGGNDRYRFDADLALGSDTVGERVGEGRDTLDFSETESLGVTVSLGLTTAQVVNANLTLRLSSADTFENLEGGQADDVLTGNDRANVVSGHGGNDRITGAGGVDTLSGGDGARPDGALYRDTLVESRDADITLSGTGLWFGGVLEDGLTGFEAAELTGGGAANVLDASIFDGDVTLNGGDGDDTLRGGFGDDGLIGGGGNDLLAGGYGDDVYAFDADGALGSDTVDDDGGVDWLDFSSTMGRVIEVNLGSVVAQTVNPNLVLTLSGGAMIENVRGGGRDDSLTGNALDNRMEGGEGADRINGGEGDDLLMGQEGDDRYVFSIGSARAQGTDTVLEEVGTGGSDTLEFNGTTSTGITLNLGVGGRQAVHANLGLYLIRGHSIENVLGSSAADTIVGNSLANRLEGRGGDDVLDGGLGDDTYAFDADSALGSDILIEDPLEGGVDVIDFSATSGTIGSAGTPFSVRTGVAQTVNAFLTVTLTGGRGFETVVPGTGTNFIRSRTAPVLLDRTPFRPWPPTPFEVRGLGTGWFTGFRGETETLWKMP